MTSLTLVRRIKARPSIVFDALITPEGIASWWGPDGGPVLVAETDPQVGGRFRVRFRMLDGSEHESSGEYLEVVKPERLSMSWRWTGGVEDPGELLVEIRLRAIVEGTELTFTHSRLHDEESCRSHEEGWTGALDKLQHHFLVANGALRDESAAEPRVATVMWSKPSTSFSFRYGNRKGAYRMITISAFKWVPEFAQGQVRDLRARWALEEAGLPYKTRLLELGDQDKPDYRALQPFGQVPILEEDGLVLFESGAIVLHIGERSEMLLPKDASGRARATQWLIAALNSIEPFVMNVALIDLFYANEEWAKLRRPGAVEFVQKRLSALSRSLGDKPYLDGDRFTAGDLMMTTVLRILKRTDIVTSEKRLAAYVHGLQPLDQVAGARPVEAKRTPAALLERGEVAERLRRDERAERLLPAGNRQVALRVGGELEEDAAWPGRPCGAARSSGGTAARSRRWWRRRARRGCDPAPHAGARRWHRPAAGRRGSRSSRSTRAG